MKLLLNKLLLPGLFILINILSGWFIATASQMAVQNMAGPDKNNAALPENNQNNPEEVIPELDLPTPEEYPPIIEEERGSDPKINIKMYGYNDLSFKFGKSFYISEKDRLNNSTLPSSPAIPNGIVPNLDIKLNATGNIGKELNMDINFDQKEVLGNNQIKVSYIPPDEKSVLKKLDIGNLEFDLGKSKLMLYQKNPIKALGVDAGFQFGDFKVQAIGVINESQREIEVFEGRRKHKVVYIDEYRYVARKYYQLEPFLYYDGISVKPSSINASNYQRGNAQALNVFTSQRAVLDSPPVNIDPGSLEIYMDTGDNKINFQLNAQPKYAGGNFLGNYYRLREGRDFTVIYRTGRISFIRPFSTAAKVFVRYTRNHGSLNSSDPSSRIENGKIETFIKFGASMNEDALKNGVLSFNGTDDVEVIRDGMVNLDIYEVRGIYDLQALDIDQMGFSLELVSTLYKDIPSLNSMDYYKVDFQNGVLEFSAREPFKNLINQGQYIFNQNDISAIYTETQSSYIYENSNVKIKSEYTASQRSFQLKHFNIVPGSEKVLINGIVVSREKYYIDYQTGFLVFLDQNDPLMSNLNHMEVNYSYIPFGQLKESYLVGSRLEYQPVKEFTAGVGAYYNADFQPLAIDYVGHEPKGLFIAGTDLNANIDENSMTSAINKIFKTQYSNVPVKVSAYGEYAQSFYNGNTMGMALIDNMETSQESMDISLTAGEWGLSSLPVSAGVSQCNRAPLYYRYYYNPQHFEYGLQSITSTPAASPDYSTLAGPYNVADGHLSSSQLMLQNNPTMAQQKSLVMDFNFGRAPDNTAPFIGIQNKVGLTPMDFSAFSQVEFYAKLDGTTGLDSGLALYLDIGSVNEDADSDGKLATEDIGLDHINGDTNGNGIHDAGETWDTGERNQILDFNKFTGDTEDIGYSFSPPGCPGAKTTIGAGPNIKGYPATIGNGILNSEDLNGNGQLDTLENVINISPANSALQFESGSNVLTPGDWKHFKVFINPSQMTEREKSLFRNVESIRVYAVPVGGSRLGSGKILIDQIRFSGSQWKNKKEKLTAAAESSLSNPSVLKVTNIDNFNSKAEYEADSFLLKKQGEYEKLYGKKTNVEVLSIKEGTLKLEYNLSSAHEYAFVEKILRESMDISFYKKINIWVNHREFSSNGAELILRVGSDPSNYLEFSSSIDKKDWQRLEFNLGQPAIITGKPITKNIKYLAVGIKNNNPQIARSGISWVNDIYVSETTVRSDYAYTYGVGVAVSKPFFVTNEGIEILSNVQMDYYKLFKNYDFQSIATTGPPMLEDRNNLHFHSRVLPFWSTDNILEDYKSDTSRLYGVTDNYYQGAFNRTQVQTRNELFQNQEYAPHILLAMSYNKDQVKQSGDTINDTGYSKTTSSKNYQPDIKIIHKIPTFFKIVNINYDIGTSATFYQRETDKSVTGSFLNTTDIPIKEKEQWEQSSESLQLAIGDFHIRGSHNHNQSLLVQKNTTDNINASTVHGDYYIPFFSQTSDFRYRQRNNGVSFETGFNNLWIFSPRLNYEVKYSEDSFHENPVRLNYSEFQSLKNSDTLATFNFSLPMIFSKRVLEKKYDNTDPERMNDNSGNNITLGFRRELKLREFSVPFSSQSSLENDPLGIQRIIPQLSSKAFNLIQYPFWYFFSSPDQNNQSFYKGREYIHSETFFISPDYNTGYASFYNNALGLTEIVSLNSRWFITPGLSVTTDSRLSQDVSRSAIEAAVLQEGNLLNSVQFYLNLMNLLNFGFWKNKSNNSTVTLGFSQNTHMFIVSNIEENSLKPDITFQFKWMLPENVLTGISAHFSLATHVFKTRQYLTNSALDNSLNYEIFTIESLYSIQNLNNYNASLEWFTELPGLKLILEKIVHTKIEHNPKFSVTLAGDINRYRISYFNYIKSDILDEFYVKNSLDMNLHQNVTGILDLFLVYDIHRHPDDSHIIQEVFSIQAGISAKILF